jgi:tetratricopeptide (TPR) repeat protein
MCRGSRIVGGLTTLGAGYPKTGRTSFMMSPVLVKQSREIERMERKLSAAMGARPHSVDQAIEALEEAIALAQSDSHAAEWFVPSELLGDLADEYEAAGRTEDALAAMRRAIEAGWRGQPDGRCRLAEILMRAGRVEEAAELWEQVRADRPDDIWLYNNAGIEHTLAGAHESALTWLDEAVRIALRTGDPEHLLDQLLDYREQALTALGRELDDLQNEAVALLADKRHRPTKSRSLYRTAAAPTRSRDPDLVAFAWFPAAEYAQALALFPEIADSPGDDHETYCRTMQARLREAASGGLATVAIAPVRLSAYLGWCAKRGEDPAQARAIYAAQMQADDLIAWPPGRNEPCWCGSGRKYKRCCALPE